MLFLFCSWGGMFGSFKVTVLFQLSFIIFILLYTAFHCCCFFLLIISDFVPGARYDFVVGNISYSTLIHLILVYWQSAD